MILLRYKTIPLGNTAIKKTFITGAALERQDNVERKNAKRWFTCDPVMTTVLARPSSKKDKAEAVKAIVSVP